jgi:hydrogenase/urease accessory protein HupE
MRRYLSSAHGSLVTATLLIVLAMPHPAGAHAAPFSYLDLRLGDAGVDGSLVLHDFDVAHDLGIDSPESLRDPSVAAKYRDQLTRLIDSRLTIVLDGRRPTLEWTGLETLPDRQSLRLTFRSNAGNAGSARVTAVLFPYDPVHQTFVNVYEDGALRHQAILDSGRTSMDYYAGSWQGISAVLAVFVPAGIEHILIGPDHVLFLIGLMLLGGSLWRLATIVTAFTIGHSITLSLAALDVVSPPSSIVEPAIALSIVFVGADNLLVQQSNAKTAKRPHDIRPMVAAVFGLVHGFGFASVLKEFGLPLTALGWSLLSFNLGVEIGQLAIVLLVSWALAAVRRRSEAVSRKLVLVGSMVVIAAGGYWFMERVFFGGGA